MVSRGVEGCRGGCRGVSSWHGWLSCRGKGNDQNGKAGNAFSERSEHRPLGPPEALRPGASLSALAADRHRDSDAAHQSSLSPTSDGRLQRSQERSENGIHPGGTGPTTRTVPQPIPPSAKAAHRPPPGPSRSDLFTRRRLRRRPPLPGPPPPSAPEQARTAATTRTLPTASRRTSTTRARGPSPRRCQRRTWRRS